MRLPALVLACLITMLSLPLRAQDEAVRAETEADTAAVSDSVYATSIAGEFRPAKGFDIVRTSRASLNISFYGLFRYMNQMPGDQTFTDHLGRERPVKARNDLNWHRTFVWLTGFFYVPRFRYNISLWSLPTTQQTLLFGNLQYRFSRALGVGVGISPNLTARSVQGSWPFWGSSDRQMAEDFFRGRVLVRLLRDWTALRKILVHRLGQHQHQPARHHRRQRLPRHGVQRERRLAAHAPASSAPVRAWATSSTTPSWPLSSARRPATAANPATPRTTLRPTPPRSSSPTVSTRSTPDALAPGVTVQKLDYDVLAVDAGFKYRGFSFQSEFYVRKLSDFLATGPVPPDDIVDKGFQVQGMHMVVPRLVGVYLTYGRVFDDFDRNPWEVSGGASYYPSRSRSWRLNLHLIRIEKSPAASNFGFYTSGQSGTTISIGTDILL